METRNSSWERFGYLVLSLALVIVFISIVEDLVNASADGFSAWDWVRAAALAGLLLSLGSLVIVRVAARRRTSIDRSSVDLARVRAAHESEGRVAAVREIRRQDPALSLLEATRMVDAL